MRTRLLLAGLLTVLVSFASAQNRLSCSVHYENNGYEYAGEYGYYSNDFIIGDMVYHWFVMPNGRRILKCRHIYFDTDYGMYFGPWEIAVHFSWDDFYPGYFTWCPVLHLYYYNHPHYVTYYHHIHSHVTLYVNRYHYRPNNIVVRRPWIYWEPWRFWRNRRWNTVTLPRHRIARVYKPHIKHGNSPVINKKKAHYVYENSMKHRVSVVKKAPTKPGTRYTAHPRSGSTIKTKKSTPVNRKELRNHKANNGVSKKRNATIAVPQKKVQQRTQQPAVKSFHAAKPLAGHKPAVVQSRIGQTSRIAKRTPTRR